MAIISSQAGQVLQVQTRTIGNGVFASTDSTNFVDVTNVYVDIAPIHANSILIWSYTMTFNTSATAGYGRFRIVDSKNSDTKWNSNDFIASYGYNYGSGSMWADNPFQHAATSGTTNLMRLQLQGRVNGGGNLRGDWSNGDDRSVVVMEVAQ